MSCGEKEGRRGRRWTLAGASAALGIALGPVAAPPAGAADWYAAPFADANLEVNDNRRLLPEGDDTVWGVVGRAGGVFGWRDPATELELRPYLTFARYPGEDDLDEDSQYLGVRWTSRAERGEVGVEARYWHYTTQSRFAPEDENLPEPGAETASLSSTSLTLGPHVEYALTRVDRLRVGYDFQRALNEDRLDYDLHTLTGRYAHALSERDTVAARAFVARYEAEDGVSTTDAIGLLAGLERKLTPLVSASFYAGPVWTDMEVVGPGDPFEDRGVGTSVELELKGEQRQYTWSAALRRALEPTSYGVATARNEAQVRGAYQLDPRQSIDVGLRVFRDETVGGLDTSADRDYADLLAGYRWQISRDLSGGMAYQFRWSDRPDTDAARGNALFVRLIYEGAATLVPK